MATPVKMPQLGESVVEGTILTWLKQEGDSVEVDEPIVEISTEKVDTEIPSPVAGTLVKLLVDEGETVEVGTELCEIDESGEAAGDEQPAGDEKPAAKKADKAEKADKADKADKAEKPEKREPEEPAEAEAEGEAEDDEEDDGERPSARPAAARREETPRQQRPAARGSERAPSRTGPPSRTDEGRPEQVLSPLVRRLAREHDIDIEQVEGTGPGGRVTRDDIQTFIDSGGAAPERETEAPRAPGRKAPPKPAEPAEREEREPAGERLAGDEVRSLSHVRKRIADHMTRSLQASARAWNAVEVDMEPIARLRAQVGEEFRRREGFSLTYLPFIARACVDALAHVEVMNASMSEDGTQATFHRTVNLGIAVAVDYGLIVPVLKGAETMTVLGVARAIRDLAERARTKKLQPDEVTGSTFTITNPGPYGSVMSVPIINQPNSAILSTESVDKRVVVVDDAIAIRHRTYLCLSWDHRIMDGSDAMQFLVRLKENLETWDFSNEVVQP